jgi:glycosyltransferase involved in cell wall biosynthesis
MSSPALSVVVVSYNMRRELPRTILSLSAKMQRDIDADEYEIIIVDNGSTDGFDRDQYVRMGENIRVFALSDPTPSPVRAINIGLEAARGNLIGVMIDGARMASPRLLARAMQAAKMHARPVIGTLAFHLGTDVQMRSVMQGYDQHAEDKLLASVNWTEDGYRLFDVSVFAGSSADGWFVMPAETNALFLTRQHWTELGGYDAAFVSPGGGLVNLDTWSRACKDKAGQVMLILGEATFHQVHGGVATNATLSPWPEFHDEYVRLRDHDYERPTGSPLIVGDIRPEILESVIFSIQRKQQLLGVQVSC